LVAGATATVSPGTGNTQYNAVLDFGIPRGPTGPTATISIASVTASSPGGAANVTNSGTSYAAALNFVVPAGPTGPTGASNYFYTYSVAGAVYTSTGTKRQYMFADSTLVRIDMYLSSNSSNTPCTIRINRNGTSWQTATIASNQTVSNTSAITTPAFSSPGDLNISQGQYITVDVTAAAGFDLTINILLIAR
jgi:hypothetical protein